MRCFFMRGLLPANRIKYSVVLHNKKPLERSKLGYKQYEST